MKSWMRMLARVGALAVLATLLTAAPSSAFEDPNAPGPSPITGGPPTSDSTNTGQVANCSVVSSPTFMGLSCGSSSTETEINVKRILGDDPVPDCWHEALSAEELSALGYENTATRVYYWKWCVSGISKEPNRYDPRFRVGIDPIDPRDRIELTVRQRRLIDLDSTNDFILPPIAVSSPMSRPRVGAWVSIFDASPEHQVTVQAGAVVLRATQTRTYVNPYGEGTSPTLSCDGYGYQAEQGDTRADGPGACWHQYERSSAQEQDNAFPVHITAQWNVDVSADGGATWSDFNSFTKSQASMVPVTEVQTFVVN